VAGRRAPAGLALAALGLTVAGCGFGSNASSGATHTLTLTRTVVVTRPATTTTSTKPVAAAAACTGDQLSGTFAEMEGSSGAGQISYALRLTNKSGQPCFVSGVPQVRLLDANGSALPTQVVPAQPGAATAALITLAPGASATANARFSPDVPGQGDLQGSSCQPVAHTLLVTPNGGGTVDVPIVPPTSVCERGRLSFQLLSLR
jgi:uncharacterized protein DUF4232